MGLLRYSFNSSHYSVFSSQYWNVTNNMLFEGKLGSNLSSLCVLSRAGGRCKQGFTASHGAVISNSWQSQTKTLFLWLPHCNNRVQRTDCLQAKNQRPRNTENSSSKFFFGNKTLLLPAQRNSKKTSFYVQTFGLSFPGNGILMMGIKLIIFCIRSERNKYICLWKSVI